MRTELNQVRRGAPVLDGPPARDQARLAALVLSIATINIGNRFNAATRQITGEWLEQVISGEPAGQASEPIADTFASNLRAQCGVPGPG